MHISLDSALGRQRRLNSVGESITQIAPDPAAAYSLRSLTGGDPKVVRVRRASDNHEQDFTASDVSSGALQDFVNAQVTAPLDIQALTATGRDGDFLIAKAAYSLRSLGTRQATLAATGDTVARADGKFVCQVRRDPDDALKSFTAAEVTDGTLVSWVGTSPATPQNITGFTLTNVTVQLIGSGGNATISGTFNGKTKWILDGESAKRIRYDGSRWEINDDGDDYFRSNITNVDYPWDSSLTWTEVEGSGTPTFGSFVGGSPTASAGSGFVKTWYDQSVTTQAGDTATGNHATQATAASQPKIVSAGALNTSGGLEFDATDDFFALTSTVSFENLPLAMFSVQDSQDNHNHHTLGCANSRGIGVSENTINYFFTSSSATLTFSSSVTGLNLYTAIHDGTTNSDNIIGHRNGVANSSSSGSGFGEANTTSAWKNIGVRSDTNDFFEGTIKEIIVYNTDQTDNRTAIEANIGEAYSIDLPSGVDPGFDQVDGFVETWYDQSGNGNDAVQATASLQPKIVDAGSLLTDGVTFDGSDDVLTSGFNSSLTNYTFAGVYTVKTITDNTGLLGKGAGSSDREFFVRMKANSTIEHRIHSTGSASPLFQIASDVTISANTTVLLAGSFNDGTNAMRLDLNGTEKTATSSIDLHSGTSSLTIASALGSEAHTAVAELLFYNTDESGKLSDIKTNINSHYSIF
jgi:hypothetical protein